MPDGLAFHMPECDALPDPLAIGDLFPPARDSITVMLAVSPRRPEGSNTSIPEHPGTSNGSSRYRAEVRMLFDETTGRDEKPVQVGRKNIALRLDTQADEDSVMLPIARIMRSGSGQYMFDPEFIPPCIQISASERLMALLGRLIEILDEKSARFSRTAPGGRERSWAEFSTEEIANFWLLHTVNSSIPPLRHHYLTRRGHPEEVYREMLRLGGALCTFAFESHPRDLPRYEHGNLEKSFGGLDRHIRTHLETIVPTQYVQIPLVKRADYFYEAQVTDQRVLDHCRWIFAIRCPISEPEVITKTPQLVKLCSKQFLPELVKRALPGMAMTHLPVPPSAIPARVDRQYFSVSRHGPCWDHIVQSRQIGLYVPGDLPGPTIELMVILEA
jgi:type VI secretion system protein ImpJ